VQIVGGDVSALMTQVAQATKLNFSILVVSSKKLGTQAQELSGAPGFIVDTSSSIVSINPTPTLTPRLAAD
jgi:hypothetical protein